ncbi:hypothetical protein ACGFN1_25085 [Streptomyces sp. NPDC048685]|uniref:hypothetical protein n=1 Tax=Streptomyces sp. NPDC048685 TaxID=3365584 RepID=UPI003723907B
MPHPHLYVCLGPGDLNRAEAKTTHPWRVEGGNAAGGLINQVVPATVHGHFEYFTTDYPRGAGHGMLLVRLHGAGAVQPWAPVASGVLVRKPEHVPPDFGLIDRCSRR